MERTPHRMPLTKTQIDRRQRSRKRNRQRRRGLRQRQRRQMDWFDNMLQSQEDMGMGLHIFEQQGLPGSASDSEYLTASDYSTDSEYFDAEEPQIIEQPGLLFSPELDEIPEVIDNQYTRCVVCLEGDNYEGLGELINPCNCDNELGWYHYTHLCVYLESTIDRRCTHCRGQFNDQRIERYGVTTNRGIQRMIRFRDYGGPGADRTFNLTEALQAHPRADGIRAQIAYSIEHGEEVDENQMWNRLAQSLDLAFAEGEGVNDFMGEIPDDLDFRQRQRILERRLAQRQQMIQGERLAQQQQMETLFARANQIFREDEQFRIDNEQLRNDNEQFMNRMQQIYGTQEDRVPQQETQVQHLLREFPYNRQFPSTGQSSLTRQSPLPPGETYGNFINVRTGRPMSELPQSQQTAPPHEDSDDEQQREVHENRFFHRSGGPPPDPSVFGESSKSQDISAGKMRWSKAMSAKLEAKRQRHQQILDQFQEFKMRSNTRLPQSQQTAQPPLLQQPFGQQPQQPPQNETSSSSDEELD